MTILEENARYNLVNKGVILENFNVHPRTRLNANQTKEVFNNTGNKTELVSNFLPMPVGSVIDSVAGYRVGDKVGHPVAGIIVGRDGAMGAASNNINGISVGDVYTPKNMAIKAAPGAISGAVVGGMLGGPAGALGGAVAGGIARPIIEPGLNYGLGTLFGKRLQNANRY